MAVGENNVVWVQGEETVQAVEEASWNRTISTNKFDGVEASEKLEPKQDDLGINDSFSSFKSMLETETDWYSSSAAINTPNQDFNTIQNHQQMRDLSNFCSNPATENLILHSVDSSSSYPLSQTFALDPSQHQPFLPAKPCFFSLLNFATPYDSGFHVGSENVFLGNYQPNQISNLAGFSGPEFQATQLPPVPDNAAIVGGGFYNLGFESFDVSSGDALISNRTKVLSPLEVLPSVVSQPTLFQKRAMSRQSDDKLGHLEISTGMRYIGGNLGEIVSKKEIEEGELDEASFDVSGLNYYSDEHNGDGKVEESVKNNRGSSSNADSTVTGDRGGNDQKGKKKGMPAKNLMAERRRRKKLNDRLYMLRSVVPKISKMDRASILGDAIDYLKELLQRINDLHCELESIPPGSLVTPTPATLPCRMKEELHANTVSSPKNQPAKVEVRVREGRVVNIHMFSGRRPGLLLSTMRALDNLGLDIQQAVISCFNGFALDVFRAEQCREGDDILPEQIKAVLLESVGFHGVM